MANQKRKPDEGKNRQRRTTPAAKPLGWINRVLMVETDDDLKQTIKNVIAPKERCRILAMGNGFDAITVLEDNLQKGRSFDAVVIDRRPSMGMKDFLDMLEKTMIQVNTVVRTITVIPVCNAEWEVRKVNAEIDIYNQEHERTRTVPRLVISRPKDKYALYSHFSNVIERTLRGLAASRMQLEIRLAKQCGGDAGRNG